MPWAIHEHIVFDPREDSRKKIIDDFWCTRGHSGAAVSKKHSPPVALITTVDLHNDDKIRFSN
jgi:hypothetical protein